MSSSATATQTGPVLHVNELAFGYDREHEPVLRGVSFQIARGEIVGLLGPSGVGKTTTVRIITGLQGGFRGTVDVLDRPIQRWDRSLYDHLGVGFEFPASWSRLTARENLELIAALHAVPARDIWELLALVGLEDAIDQRVSRFSKGMSVRLNVARALLHRPALVVLDEPTGGLDPVTARRVRRLIRSEADRGAAVLVTTHDLTTVAEMCDRVGFLSRGILTPLESPADLRRRFGRREVEVGYRVAGELITFACPLDGLADNDRFLKLLRAGVVESIHTREADMTEVFHRLTEDG